MNNSSSSHLLSRIAFSASMSCCSDVGFHAGSQLNHPSVLHTNKQHECTHIQASG